MKTRFCLSLTALFFACSVLFVSLFTATSASSSGYHPMAAQKLYFGSDILPDNVLYPVMMASDRIQLETASSYDRIFIQVEYANRRLDYAQQLLKMEKEALALTTLSKAENYLQHAVHEAVAIEANDSVKQRLLKSLVYHADRMHELSPQFTDANRVVVDKLLEENKVISQALQSP